VASLSILGTCLRNSSDTDHIVLLVFMIPVNLTLLWLILVLLVGAVRARSDRHSTDLILHHRLLHKEIKSSTVLQKSIRGCNFAKYKHSCCPRSGRLIPALKLKTHVGKIT
jgi:hypothetical protein